MNNRNRSRCSIAIVIFALSPPAVAQECPEFVGSVDIDRPGVPWAIAVSNGYAYVAAGTDGLRVIDVRLPSAPVEVGSLDTPGDARNLAVSGNQVFVADGNSRRGSAITSDRRRSATIPEPFRSDFPSDRSDRGGDRQL